MKNRRDAMSAKNQLVGMMGVYLTAAELSRRGFIASPTSRSARGADILATDLDCQKAFAIQVKTNTAGSSYWLLNKDSKKMVSDSHIYIFLRIKEDGISPEFYVVPSRIVAEKMYIEKFKKDTTWYSFTVEDATPYLGKWDILNKGDIKRSENFIENEQ